MLLMGCVVWFLAILARDHSLSNRSSVACLVLLMILGFLTKPSTPAFMLPPAILIWLWRRDDRTWWTPVIFALALGASGTWLWQGADWLKVLDLARIVTKAPLDFPPMEGANWSYYLNIAVTYQLGIAGAILAGLGLARHRRSPLAWMVVIAALGGIAAHTGLSYRKHYYTTPILPPLAALASVWLVQARLRLRWAAGALMLIALLHSNWGLPGVADAMPTSLRSLGLNHPRTFNPGPQKVPTKVGRATAIALALAEQDGRLELLRLPRAPKLVILVERTELLSFERAFVYEVARRGAPMHTIDPHHGESINRARLIVFEGREPNLDGILAGCRSLDSAQLDLHERNAKQPCPFDRQGIEQLLAQVTIIQRTEVAPGLWRSLGVLPVEGDRPWGPLPALRALRYAAELGVELDPMVSKEAAAASPEMIAIDAATPLQFFRGLAHLVEAEGHG